MATVFDDLLLKGIRGGQIPARTQDARNWFRDRAKGTGATPERIVRGNKEALKNRPAVGRMYHFYYDPKGKQKLPYYDTFPLIFMVGPATGGFYGINMHYLPLKLRATLMDALYDTTNNKKYDESTRLKVSYDTLKGASKFKAFKPTFKHYLSTNVRSRFIQVEPSEWDIALFLPTERFVKSNKRQVHAASRKLIT
jgi:hypothetical protein